MKTDWTQEGSSLGSTSVSSNVPAPLLVTPQPFRVGPEGHCSLFPGRRRAGSRKKLPEKQHPMKLVQRCMSEDEEKPQG